MSDKVQLIKEEIERRIVQAEEFAERAKGANDDSSKLSWDFVATQNKSLLQFIDSLPEEHNEDLDETADEYAQQHSELLGFDCDCEPIQTGPELKKAVKFGAEWQKQKDKQLVGATQKISHQHGYDEGRADMREEMMKDAVNGEIVVTSDNGWESIRIQKKEHCCGDKVKIIIVKTE